MRLFHVISSNSPSHKRLLYTPLPTILLSLPPSLPSLLPPSLPPSYTHSLLKGHAPFWRAAGIKGCEALESEPPTAPKWVTSHRWLSQTSRVTHNIVTNNHVTLTHESRHSYARVVSLIWMGRVKRMNEPCYIHEWYFRVRYSYGIPCIWVMLCIWVLISINGIYLAIYYNISDEYMPYSIWIYATYHINTCHLSYTYITIHHINICHISHEYMPSRTSPAQHTWKRVLSCRWMRHVARMKSCRTYECVMSRVWMRECAGKGMPRTKRELHMNETCHMCKSAMSHV